MADTFSYRFLVTAPGGGEVRDLTALVQSLTWTGDVRQTARELTCALAVPRDGSVEIPPLEEGAWLTLEAEGTARFFGTLLQCTTSSQSVTVNLSALDRGRFLAGNEGYYNFSNTTPEAAAALICRDFQIPTAGLAATGIPLNRNFPGETLDAILRTLYAAAGEQNGKRYQLRFTGTGELEIVEKPSTASLEIAQTMGVTNTWNITDLCNSVAIYTDGGALVRTVEDGPS